MGLGSGEEPAGHQDRDHERDVGCGQIPELFRELPADERARPDVPGGDLREFALQIAFTFNCLQYTPEAERDYVSTRSIVERSTRLFAVRSRRPHRHADSLVRGDRR